MYNAISTGISSTIYITYNDFYDCLKEFPEDYVIFYI